MFREKKRVREKERKRKRKAKALLQSKTRLDSALILSDLANPRTYR